MWSGQGQDEIGKDSGQWKVLIEVDKPYFRLTEVDYLEGVQRQK